MQELKKYIKTNWLYAGSIILFATINFSFVWFYENPLAADMPMHVAIAKAVLDLIGNPDIANYPYIFNIKFSTYALADMVLIIFIKPFGVLLGTKIALSVYSLLFSFAVFYLVGSINPESKWTRLIGFPLAHNYFFHWGFWPAILSLAVAIFAVGASIRYVKNNKGLWKVILSRLLVLFFHPIPILAIGCHDIVICLIDYENNTQWYNPAKWNWGRMFKIWTLPILLTPVLFISIEMGVGEMEWCSIKEQMIQLIRPLYLTSNWWESALLILLTGLITINIPWKSFIKSRWNISLTISALFVMICGLCIPREEFMQAWECGARVSFVGIIIIISAWSLNEKRLKKYILIWLVLAFSINLTSSHYLWKKHSSSFDRALNNIKNNYPDSHLRLRNYGYEQFPSIMLGGHITEWAWALGYIIDTDNLVGRGCFGPVKYIGLDDIEKSKIKNGVVVYHPYMFFSPENYGAGVVLMEYDKIYTIYDDNSGER